MLNSLTAAFALLTALPLRSSSDRTLTPDVAGYFPLVGLAIGAVSLFLLEAARSTSLLLGDGTLLSRGGVLLGGIVVALAAWMTRALHWDGLADTADAIWSPGNQERKLEIMADSATGAFGATAVALVAIAQVGAYAAILQEPAILGWVVLATPVLARASASFAAWLGKPLRPGGLGASLMGKPSIPGIIFFGVTLLCTLAAIAFAHEVAGLLWCVFALLVAPVIPHLIASRIGGVTGDVMGASVLVTETVLLACAGLASVI